MSDQPKWMPDTELLCMAFDLSDQAWEEISDGERGPDGSWLDPLRAVVRAAVEKALADRESRHKREVLEAKIDTLTAHGDCVCPIYSVYGERLSAVDPECVVCSALKRLESELAALEVKP